MNVGILGIGFMGMIHYLAYQKLRGVRVAAICTRNQKRLAGDWRGIQGNFGPPGEKMDLSGVAKYAELDQMLADPQIDVVDIALPPGRHAEAAIKSFKAGKHVFCEKPMALTRRECQQMSAAAEKSGKLLMIGHTLPFFPEYAWAYKAVTSGKYGALLGGSFKRVIADPQWLPDYYDPLRVGGPMLDLHVHDAHYLRLLFGMPIQVSSQGRMRGEVVESWNTQFRFENPDLTVSAASGVIRQQGRPFTHGFEIQLEKATLAYEFAVIGGEPRLLMPLTLFDARGKATEPKLGPGDPLHAFESEIKEVARAVRSGQNSPILAGALAQDAVVLCHKQTQSVMSDKPIRV